MIARAQHPVGVISIKTVGELADLHRIVVEPRSRRRGIGADLVRAGLEVVRRLGVREVILDVAYDNEPAIALYQQLGFEQLSARKDYYGPGQHALILKLYDLQTWPDRIATRDGGSVSSSPSLAAGGPLMVGIESSCDETGVGIVRGHELLANEVASSVELHVRFGGVVPEVASRAHLEAMVPTLQRACATADIDLSEIDGVAVTVGPGLMGALVVGLASAKALAYALNKPLYGVNHLVGHVAVDLLEHGPLPERCIALLVSGGHTSLLQVESIADSIVELGSTIDDAAGEAYDKVARVLGLPYPGGPYIDKAATGDPSYVRFPRGLTARKDLERHRFDFSFSGLKTAVARWVEARQRDGPGRSSGRRGSELPGGGLRCAEREGHGCLHGDRGDRPADWRRRGGQRRLRALLAERAGERGISLRTPRPNLCTDNGAMIAVLGAEIVAGGGKPSALDIGADSSLPVSKILV